MIRLEISFFFEKSLCSAMLGIYHTKELAELTKKFHFNDSLIEISLFFFF